MSPLPVPFRVCPSCADTSLSSTDGRSVRCSDCGFVYFHNNAAATGVVIRCDQHVLFIVRGAAPSKGLIDVPGGFVDYGESLEQAALRETHEETGIVLQDIAYLASFANVYEYRGVIYQTCDVYFEARVPQRPAAVAGDDAAGVAWRRPAEVRPEELAFDSVRRLHRLLCEQGSR